MTGRERQDAIAAITAALTLAIADHAAAEQAHHKATEWAAQTYQQLTLWESRVSSLREALDCLSSDGPRQQEPF